MKKLAFIGLLLTLSISSFSQADTTRPLTKADYLAKSRGQKVAGFILTGIGLTCFAVAAPGNVSFDELGTLVTAGTIAILGSIPLYIAAGRNKRKARRANATLDLQKIHGFQPNGFAFQYYPAVKLKFRL